MYECDVCGSYTLTGSAIGIVEQGTLSPIVRASISHMARRGTLAGSPIVLNSYALEEAIKSARLPSPPEQADLLIRDIGDHWRATAEPLPIDDLIGAASTGAPSPNAFKHIRQQLEEDGLLRTFNDQTFNPVNQKGAINYGAGPRYDLTLKGWAAYEATARSLKGQNYGFLALKFGDPELNKLVQEHLKPAVKDALGFDIVTMLDVAQAGIIDNLMRERIRYASFVIVDLSHDNNGAYWEAGYAEGLGKQVIYICEGAKFKSAKTHFDTNHCTTVTWSLADAEHFEKEIVATIRRSLKLFDQ